MPPHRRSHARSLPTHLDLVRRSLGARDPRPGPPHRRGTSQARLRAVVIDGVGAAGSLAEALGEADVTVIGEVPSAREGLEMARRTAPDLAVVDLSTGDGSLALVERLGSLDLGIRSVLVTGGCDPEDGVAAIRAGARAFMTRVDLLRCSLPRLLEAVMADELVCSRSMATALAGRLRG